MYISNRAFSFLALSFLIVISACASPEVPQVSRESLGETIAIDANEIQWPSEPEQLPEAIPVYEVTSRVSVSSIVESLAIDHAFEAGSWLPKGFGTTMAGALAYKKDDRVLCYAADRNAFYMWLKHGSDYPKDEDHRPLPVTVLSRQEAFDKAVEMFPVFGLNKNDFHADPKTGELLHRAVSDRVGFIDRVTNEPQSMLLNIRITFIRSVGDSPADPSGEGGSATFTFIDKGELASVQWAMRGYSSLGEFPGISLQQLRATIEKGRSFAFAHDFECDVLKVRRIELAYNEEDVDVAMTHFIPLYLVWCEIQGGPRDGHEIILRIPALRIHH